MALTVLDSDVRVTGDFSAATMTVSASAVSNSQVSSTAAIAVTKLQHLHKIGTDFGIAADAAPSADVFKVLFKATGTATIRAFKAVLRDTGTSSDVKFDLQKASSGSATLASVLTATVDFTNADTDNTTKTGNLSSTALVSGDMLVAKMDHTSATGVLGPFCWIEIDEAAN